MGDQVTEETIDRLTPFLNHADFDDARLRSCSTAGAALCLWVWGLVEYYDSRNALAPMLEDAADAEAQLRVLKQAHTEHLKLWARLAVLSQQHSTVSAPLPICRTLLQAVQYLSAAVSTPLTAKYLQQRERSVELALVPPSAAFVVHAPDGEMVAVKGGF